MKNSEKIEALRKLKEYPRTMINQRPDKVKEALDWAIGICQTFVEEKEKEGVRK